MVKACLSIVNKKLFPYIINGNVSLIICYACFNDCTNLDEIWHTSRLYPGGGQNILSSGEYVPLGYFVTFTWVNPRYAASTIYIVITHITFNPATRKSPCRLHYVCLLRAMCMHRRSKVTQSGGAGNYVL